MSDTPFIKFYPSDFLGGTSGLSPAERGVYITLLCLIYEYDGPVPRDDARLARRCGAPKATFRRALEALILDGKITEENGALSNKRAEKALVDRQNRSRNATIAINKRWDAQREKSEQKQGRENTGVSDTYYGRDTSQKPEPDIGGGGGRAREVGVAPPPAVPPPPDTDPTNRERFLTAIGADPISGMFGPNGRCLGNMADMQEAQRWQRDLHLSADEIVQVIREVMAKKTDGPPSTFRYFSGAMQRFAGSKSRPTLTPIDGGNYEQNHNATTGWSPSTPTGRANAGLIAGFARAVSEDGR